MPCPAYRRRRLLSALSASLAVVVAGISLAAVPEPVAGKLRAARLAPENLGLVVWRLDEATPRLVNEATTPFAPASTMKTVTTQIALDWLGPAWRARTELFATGPVDNGVLRGDLVLRAGGAPDVDRAVLRRLLEEARNTGVEDIAGDFVVDRTLFHPARVDLGVPPFDESPEFRYNVIPDALLLNQHLVAIEVSAPPAGRGAPSVRARLLEPLANVTITAADMTPTDQPCAQWESGWSVPRVVRHGPTGDDDFATRLEIRLSGSFPRDCTQVLHLNVLDAADHTARLLADLWRNLNGRLRGTIRERLPGEPLALGSKALAVHVSRPLGEIVRDINKPSDNAITRQLLMSLGEARRDDPAVAVGRTSRERGALAIRAWFHANGIDDAGLVIDNGSGLSRSERIQPMQLAQVLRIAYRGKWSPEFLSSLPIVGLDGTMRARLRQSAAFETARIKTGTLRDVVAVAGYVRDAKGRPYVLVGMLNHPTAGTRAMRPVADALIEWVASLSD